MLADIAATLPSVVRVGWWCTVGAQIILVILAVSETYVHAVLLTLLLSGKVDVHGSSRALALKTMHIKIRASGLFNEETPLL